MKNSIKIFIVLALMCVSATAAYSQDCNSYLQQATELRDKGDYCQAKQYYQMYQNCNADADVSTEIAMCENRIKMQDPGKDCPDYVPENGGNTTSARKSTLNSASSRNSDVQTATSVSKQSSIASTKRIKVGLSAGGLLPYADGQFGNVNFGGNISGEYLVTPHIGVGLSVGYYSLGKESYDNGDGSSESITSYLIPGILTGKYYFLTKSVQPYAGVDVGLYTIDLKDTENYGGQSASVSASKSYFGVAPVVGLQFRLSEAFAIDVNAKYNFIFTEGVTSKIIGFNLGIIYSF